MAASKPQRSNVKLIAFLVIPALVALVGWGVWKASIFGQGPSKLGEELRSAKADGLPLDANDLRRATAVADDQNAAPLLLAAFAELKRFEKTPEGQVLSDFRKSTGIFSASASSPHRLPQGAADHSKAKLPRDEPLRPATTAPPRGSIAAVTATQLRQLAPSLSHLSHFFEVLGQAVQKPKLDYHRIWEAGGSMELPEFAEEKSCLAALIFQAKIDLNAGRTIPAMDLLDVGARLTALVGQDPVIIALMVQTGMKNQICEVLEGAIKAHPYDPMVLERSRLALKDLGALPDVRPAMQTEFLMGRMLVQRLANSDAAQAYGAGSGGSVVRLARFGPVRTLFDLRFTQVCHSLYRDVSQRPNSFLAIQRAFREGQTALDQKSSKDWTYGFAELYFPILEHATDVMGEAEAKRNVLLSAVDLLDAKRRSSQFPAKILGTSGYWIDPFTERPLLYHPSKSGFVIYSVGKDLKDDGGIPRSTKHPLATYDIPFRFP